MILDNTVLIYAVYNHNRPQKLNEHFLKSVPSMAEAEEIKEMLLNDPDKADNILRLVFRSKSIDRRGKR